jgi:hypothetical protein
MGVHKNAPPAPAGREAMVRRTNSMIPRAGDGREQRLRSGAELPSIAGSRAVGSLDAAVEAVLSDVRRQAPFSPLQAAFRDRLCRESCVREAAGRQRKAWGSRK